MMCGKKFIFLTLLVSSFAAPGIDALASAESLLDPVFHDTLPGCILGTHDARLRLVTGGSHSKRGLQSDSVERAHGWCSISLWAQPERSKSRPGCTAQKGAPPGALVLTASRGHVNLICNWMEQNT